MEAFPVLGSSSSHRSAQNLGRESLGASLLAWLWCWAGRRGALAEQRVAGLCSLVGGVRWSQRGGGGGRQSYWQSSWAGRLLAEPMGVSRLPRAE